MTVYIATNCIDLTAAAGGGDHFQPVTKIVHCLKEPLIKNFLFDDVPNMLVQ